MNQCLLCRYIIGKFPETIAHYFADGMARQCIWHIRGIHSLFVKHQVNDIKKSHVTWVEWVIKTRLYCGIIHSKFRAVITLLKATCDVPLIVTQHRENKEIDNDCNGTLITKRSLMVWQTTAGRNTMLSFRFHYWDLEGKEHPAFYLHHIEAETKLPARFIRPFWVYRNVRISIKISAQFFSWVQLKISRHWFR